MGAVHAEGWHGWQNGQPCFRASLKRDGTFAMPGSLPVSAARPALRVKRNEPSETAGGATMIRILLMALAVVTLLPASGSFVPVARHKVNAGSETYGPVAEMLPGTLACGQREAMVSELQNRFQEVPTAIGVVDETAVMEIFTSEAGSWTIMATNTAGRSCIMAVGEGFESNLPRHEAAIQRMG